MTVLVQLIENIREVRRNKGVEPPPIDAATRLDATCALDSLDYAELFVRMHMALGVDPFATSERFDIETVRDLARIYERAKAGVAA